MPSHTGVTNLLANNIQATFVTPAPRASLPAPLCDISFEKVSTYQAMNHKQDKYGSRYLWALRFFLAACLVLAGSGCWTTPKILSEEEQIILWEKEGTVFRTGIKTRSSGNLRAGAITYAVSPNGKRILFSTNNLGDDGLWLLNLESDHLSRVLGEAGRAWSMPSWSRDGKQVVAISTKVLDGLYYNREREIILLDSVDWSYRKLVIPLGNNSSPSFSADGKSVFFLKGVKWEHSKRSYAVHDLYAYDLSSDLERRLTQEEVSEAGGGGMNEGYDGGEEIFFSAKYLKRLPSKRFDPVFRRDADQAGIYALNKATLSLRLLEVDQQEGFFDLIFGGRDKYGNIYFKASLEKPRGGNFLKPVYRCNANGQNCVRLSHDIYPLGGVEVSSKTEEIFVDDRLGGKNLMGGEIVFRRLFQPSEPQH